MKNIWHNLITTKFKEGRGTCWTDGVWTERTCGSTGYVIDCNVKRHKFESCLCRDFLSVPFTSYLYSYSLFLTLKLPLHHHLTTCFSSKLSLRKECCCKKSLELLMPVNELGSPPTTPHAPRGQQCNACYKVFCEHLSVSWIMDDSSRRDAGQNIAQLDFY